MISSQEVANIANSMKNLNTLDYYMSNVFLKKIINANLFPLTICINETMTTGIFPEFWKISKMIPFYKKGSRNESNNYRPI